MTDDAEELKHERAGRLGDRMDMSFGVVMDGPDKAIMDETSRVESMPRTDGKVRADLNRLCS